MDNKNIDTYKKINVSTKEITRIKYEIMEKKIQQIKEACAKLKNSPVSKNMALKEIQNICLSKADDEKMWKDILNQIN